MTRRRSLRYRFRRLRRRMQVWWRRLMWAGVVVVAVVVAAVVVTAVAPGLGGTQPSAMAGDEGQTELSESAVRAHLLTDLNEFRESHDRAPLTRKDNIAAAAESHADDMAAKDYLAHEQPDGDTLRDRYTEAGAACGGGGGENVAMTYYETTVRRDDGSTTRYATAEELAQGIIRQWANSPRHRENMLARDYLTVGHGVGVTTTDDGTTAVYVAQDFC